MLHFVSGDPWKRAFNIRVNTVNCIGVMVKGIALAFKHRYPQMFIDYARACALSEVQPGKLHVYWIAADAAIVNLPTKRHWRDPSRIYVIPFSPISYADM